MSTSDGPTTRSGSFLSFPQLMALAVMAFLSAGGLVSVGDLSFVVFSVIYIYFISHVSFPPTSANSDYVFGPGNKLLIYYVSTGGVVGLLLPVAYIFHGIYWGDSEGVKAAAPHAFLLASQVLMEGLAFSHGFSVPVRAFVPVFYNSRRIFSILEWLSSAFSEEHEEFGKRLWAGRLLAVANIAFWSFNLFGFLVPIYLPKVFKKYYSAGPKVKD